jgi:hypothetical protein
MDIVEIGVDEVGNDLEYSCLVKNLPMGVSDFRLWFRVPRLAGESAVACGDPFLAALLPSAARTGDTLRVHGPVSAQLQAGCRRIGEIWKDWFGTTTRFEVESVAPVVRGSTPNGAGCFFTGGVDSFYSILKNLERKKGEHRLTDLIYVGGFDIPLENSTLYRQVVSNLDRAGDALGVPVRYATSNLRELTDCFAGWGVYQHGAGLAAVAHCMQGHFREVMFPATHTYSLVFPWGTHPLLDPLWSTESLTIVSDGSEADRLQKIIWQVSRSDAALEYLRVCYRNPENSYNCCVCEKCVRTMIGLEIAGVLDRCKTFPDKLDLELVRSMKIKLRITERFAVESLAELKKRGTAPDLEAALQEAVARGRVSVFGRRARRWLSALDYKYLSGRLQRISMASRIRKRV